MKFHNVMIESFESYLPEEYLSSEEIESKLDTVYQKLKLPQGRLELMTGIQRRGYWPKGTPPSQIATSAAQKIFENHPVLKNEVDLLIHSSVCRDFLEPATASVIHANLKLKDQCMIFDLSNACLGMLNSFVVAAHMIEKGTIKRALIVSGENGGPLLFDTIETLLKDSTLTRKSIKKYIANLTIGSAAVAFTLCHKDLAKEQAHQLLGGAFLSDTTANHLCRGDGNTSSLMMETHSEELLSHGIELAQKTLEQTLGNLQMKRSQIDWAIGHQVGKAHEELTMKAMGLHQHKTYTTYPNYGNTGSAALPITLVELAKQQKLKKNDHLMLLGIGSGLSSIMLGVKW